MIAQSVAIRGRDGVPQVELGDDKANAILTPNGGRGGVGVGAVLCPTHICMSSGQANSEISENVSTTLTTLHEAPIVAHSLRAEGFDASEDGTGRGTPLVPTYGIAGNIIGRKPENGGNGDGWHEDVGYTLTKTDIHAVCFSYQAGGTQTTLGYDSERGTAPTLNKSQTAAVAFAQNTRDEVRELGGNVAGALAAQPGMKQQTYLMTHEVAGTMMSYAKSGGDSNRIDNAASGYMAIQPNTMQVRRLTPRECERLQGFPDDFTLVPYRNKPAADGPRYKALGNSMAVPVIRWLGERIDAVERLAPK